MKLLAMQNLREPRFTRSRVTNHQLSGSSNSFPICCTVGAEEPTAVERLSNVQIPFPCLDLQAKEVWITTIEDELPEVEPHTDVSKLFYPSTAEALEAEAKAKKKDGIFKLGSIGCLPRPSIHYQPFSSAVSNPNSLVNVFALFGENKNKNKILYSNVEGHTNIYNTEFHSFMTMPALNSPKGPNCMVAHITRTAAHVSLYMMDMGLDKPGCFEVLAYYPVGEWQWRLLPLPPFFDDLEYKACNNIPYAVVDGTRICVSSATATYSFDTVALKWSKTGDWVLPFHTKADFVPELNLWLGLPASSPSDLCAVDLSTGTIDSCDVPPVVQHVGLGFDLPKD
uniref:Uncharacterized protein n=1 Tax=Setaria italica TaxID=4555 RepID=K3YDP7_SETIT